MLIIKQNPYSKSTIFITIHIMPFRILSHRTLLGHFLTNEFINPTESSLDLINIYINKNRMQGSRPFSPIPANYPKVKMLTI